MTTLLVTLVVLTLIKSTPLIYAALGGVISERSGVINIGLEGMMAAGAFVAVAVSFATHSPIAGALAGVAAGACFGYLLAFAATRFKADQIVAGTGINLICAGGAAYGLVVLFNQPGASPQVASLGRKLLDLDRRGVCRCVVSAVAAVSHAMGSTDPGVWRESKRRRLRRTQSTCTAHIRSRDQRRARRTRRCVPFDR